MPEPGPRRSAVTTTIIAACISLAGAGAVWAAAENHATSCSWPLRVRGRATAEQARLVRCYLRGLAGHDAAQLMAVAADIPAVRITKADLAYSAGARSGLATATFTPSPVDDTYVLLTITYANGVRENTGILNMVAMGGPSYWRMTIGTAVKPPAGPAPSSART
jgi:hypothetical protein